MSTPEDKLAALLREQAETVVPAGDGLMKIQKRVAARRKARWMVVPSAALVTAAAVAAFFVFADGKDARLTQVPTSPGPSVSETTPSASPSAAPTVVGGGLDHAFKNPALWPFTSAQQIAAWQTTYPYADDKVTLVGHYLADVLRLTGLTTSTTCESCDVVVIKHGTVKVGEASLERFLLDGHQVYTISSIGGTDLTILTPTTGEAIGSPATVTGRVTGVDENVNLTLVTQAGKAIATGGAPAGSEAPWSAKLSWSDTDWTNGGIVAKTFSPKDGSLNRLTATPVLRDSTASAAGSTFAGARDGRIDLFDAETGDVVKHLTFPPAGKTDTDASYADGSLLWLRTQQTGCQDALYRLDNGKASTVVPAGSYHLGYPQLSDDGRTVSYYRTPCTGTGDPAVVITGPQGTTVLSTRPDETYAVLAVADTGAALVSPGFGEGGVVLTPPGATTLKGTALQPSGGCQLTSAAFDGTEILAFEQCVTNTERPVRYTSSGTRGSTGSNVRIGWISSVSIRDGKVLVVGTFSDRSKLQVFRFADGKLTPITDPNVVRSAAW
ncbi:MAG: Gmad2 immunoglobulin-like domain-containing protein [Mycobacteriales bacterium]